MKHHPLILILLITTLLSFNLTASSLPTPDFTYEVYLATWQQEMALLRQEAIQRVQDYALAQSEAVCLALADYKDALVLTAIEQLTTTPPALTLTTPSSIQVTTSSAIHSLTP